MQTLVRLSLALFAAALVASPAGAQSFMPLDGPELSDSGVIPASLTGFGGALAVSGGDVLVGEGETSLRSGLVYVYRRGADGTWGEADQIAAPTADRGDSFGTALASSGDWLLVGAPELAAAFLYQREGDQWSYVGELAGPEGVGFGRALALDAESGLAVVGAPLSEDNRGAAHVFRMDDAGDWSEVGQLTVGSGSGELRLGTSVVIRGEHVLAGAPGRQEGRGSVYAFRDGGDGWRVLTEFSPRGAEDGAGFGAALAVDGERVVVGAPNHNGTGAAFLFGVDDSGEAYSQAGQVVAFQPSPGAMFGMSVAADDEALWVGAPRALQTRGAVHVFQQAEWGFSGVSQLSGEEMARQAAFGYRVAVAGDVAAVNARGVNQGSGAVVIFERDEAGQWHEAQMFASEGESLPVIAGETRECVDGRVADLFECSNVELLSFLPISEIGGDPGIRLNDTWGWHDEETGREIVLVGRTNGTAFVDITDPNNPVYLGEVLKTEGSPDASWRDFKVYKDHAFIVADASGQHGMQVFNLRRLDDFDGEPITFEPDLTYDRINSAHNIGLNPDTGILYIVGASGGGETCGGGLHMVDANDPLNPEFLGCFADERTGRAGTGYSHDVQCVTYHGPDERYQGHEICMGSNETHLSVADVTDKANPTALSIAEYPNSGYVHQGWFDEEHRYFYMQDELALMNGLIDNTRTVIFDVADLEDPVVVGEFFFDTRAVSHNLYIRGDLIYEANYSSGLRILDISDRENPVEVGWIDTAPTHEAEPMFEGAWSTYPYFRDGVTSVSSIGEGLFIVRFQDPRPVS
ncbi:MAG: choice-of-anchor B family protein [Gemmatimonadales bacterium]|nr:MAG: choice-of-anchor B family protein [Gemmatimonadales bacterium]